jgi:hypothetical protein
VAKNEVTLSQEEAVEIQRVLGVSINLIKNLNPTLAAQLQKVVLRLKTTLPESNEETEDLSQETVQKSDDTPDLDQIIQDGESDAGIQVPDEEVTQTAQADS